MQLRLYYCGSPWAENRLEWCPFRLNEDLKFLRGTHPEIWNGASKFIEIGRYYPWCMTNKLGYWCDLGALFHFASRDVERVVLETKFEFKIQ